MENVIITLTQIRENGGPLVIQRQKVARSNQYAIGGLVIKTFGFIGFENVTYSKLPEDCLADLDKGKFDVRTCLVSAKYRLTFQIEK